MLYRLLPVALAVLASPLAAAQTPTLFTYCNEGEANRVCGYDPTTIGGGAMVQPGTYPGGFSSISVNGGKLLTYRFASGVTTFVLSNLDGSNPSDFGSMQGIPSTISLSPDLTRIAYTDGVFSLYVYTPSTGQRRELLTQGQDGFRIRVNAPEWSPDGQQLLVNVMERPNDPFFSSYGIGVIPADGSGSLVRITTPSENQLPNTIVVSDLAFDWSFSGDRIVFVRSNYAQLTGNPAVYRSQVFSISPSGGSQTELFSETTGLNGAKQLTGVEWSGDDSDLALMGSIPFGENPTRGTLLYTMPATGGSLTQFSREVQGSSQFITRELLQWTGSRSLVVTDTGDGADTNLADDLCDADASAAGEQCTLRAALQIANRQSGRDEITFDLSGSGPHTISVSSALPVLTGPVVLDGTSQPGYEDTPIVFLQGSGAAGLALSGGDSEVRGLAIGGFSTGITLSGTGENTIEGNYIGLSPAGVASPNGAGIVVNNSPDHVIGGDETEKWNVISGNTGAGVSVTGMASTGIVIAGNRIGTNAAGTAALANGAEGVLVDGAPGVRIGGLAEAARNLIAGNGTHGVRITGAEADGVQVIGNWIGLGADGTTALPNGTDATEQTGHHGVTVVSAPNAVIGGETATAGASPGNVIAASAAHGVYVTGTPDAPADGAKVLGSLIGTDRTGGTARVNGAAAVYLGGAARNAQIGEAGAANVIVAGTDGDGNSRFGVALFGFGEAGGYPDNATVSANTIGLNRSGSTLLGHLSTGVVVATTGDDGGVQGVTIGGEERADGNLIAGEGIGVGVIGTRSAGTIVAANTIGLKAGGQLAREERSVIGIWVFAAHGSQLVSNVVAGHLIGVVVTADDVSLLGNFVGTNPTGTQARPNTVGVYVPGEIRDGPSVGDRTRIGAEGAGNVISGNQNDGLRIGGDFIGGSATTLWRDLGASAVAALAAQANETPVAEMRAALARSPRPPAGKAGSRSPDSLVVAYNRIGTDRAGREELGNGRSGNEDNASAGIWVRDGRGTRLLGNVVGGNGFGVIVFGDEDYGGDPREVTIAASIIGGTADLGGSIPNQYAGVAIVGSANNKLMAAPLTSGGDTVGNVFRRNGNFGVIIRPIEGERGNTVRSSSFIDSRGPSIELLNGDLEYPSVAPRPPAILSAVRTDDGARLRFSAGTTGEVDVFASTGCDGGHAQGSFIGSGGASAGQAELPVTGLPGGTAPRRLYLALTLTETTPTGSTSSFSDCVRIAEEEDVVEVSVSPGETGRVLEDVQIEVEVVENADGGKRGGDGGLLAASLYGEQLPPQPGPFEGSATAPDGSTVTPNAVSSDRHWALRTTGLEGITYNVCIDGSGIGGSRDPDQLLVVHRETPGHPWTPYATTRDGGTLCASGLTAWGEIGIGGDDAVNPVPSEPTPEVLPEALAVTAYPNPSRGAAVARLAVPVSGPVRAAVHDALGREVAVLLDGPMSAGETEIALPRLAPGVYVVRLSTLTGTASAAVTVVR